MAQTINKDIIIGDLLDIDFTVVPILMAHGMHCVGCPSSAGESLAEACYVHGIDVVDVVNDINNYLAGKEASDQQ